MDLLDWQRYVENDRLREENAMLKRENAELRAGRSTWKDKPPMTSEQFAAVRQSAQRLSRQFGDMGLD